MRDHITADSCTRVLRQVTAAARESKHGEWRAADERRFRNKAAGISDDTKGDS